MSWGKFKSMYWGWGWGSNVQGEGWCYKSCPGGGGGECVNGIKHVLQQLQIISWM